AEHRELRRLAQIPNQGAPRYVAFAPDGKTMTFLGRIQDVGSGKFVRRLRHQDPGIDTRFEFSPVFYAPDGHHAISAEPDGVRVWDLATGREARFAVRWINHHDHAALSPDARFLATRGPGDDADAEARPIVIWELVSGRQVGTLEAHRAEVDCREFSPDGRFLATAGRPRGPADAAVVRVWDLATGREVRSFAGHRG